jgi:uncharacterized protein YecE (DUF72 family)
MKFGKVTENELDRVDFSLPVEPAGNVKVLGGKQAVPVKLHIGCPRWEITEWVGKIYSPKTKEKDFLDQYTQHFNCIELNATHYKVYDAAAITKWKEKARGKDFKFCPKMYQGITHQGSLAGKELVTSQFLQSIKTFEGHLGPVFIQLSDSFGPNRKDELFAYLGSLPREVQFFLELRHPDWFSDENTRKQLFNTLYSMKMGAVITDTAGRRDTAHMYLTVPKAFVRFVANSLHPTDYTRIDVWVDRIKHWIDHGLQELYFFMHMHNEEFCPELTVYMADKLYAACGLQLEKPKFIEQGLQPKGEQISFF